MSLKYEYFGKYVLLDKVAAGGMAEVYRAKAPGAEGIGKIIAIKRILPQYSTNSDFIDMFKSEAKIAINLTQANIAQIYEFGEEKNQFYLVMEYVDGRNLRQVLSRCAKLQKALTIEQCVFAIGQVAAGLDCAHRCIDKNTGGPLNIIHRDMSPQNIMVSFEGEVKIVDFGIAKAESKIENTRAGTLKGKFGYMSPEQAEGLELDARTDIFSTGIVLWELLSGERLFIANNEVNTIRKIKECQIPSLRKINPNIHEELERISLKALAKDRNLRYQTAAELHRDLSRFLYKVNPEFTPHDLSLTVKTLFKDDILEDRKKSLEFAKIKTPDRASVSGYRDEIAVGTATETMVTQTETSETEPGGQVKVDVPKSLINDSKMKVEAIDFSGVDGREVVRSHLINHELRQISQPPSSTFNTGRDPYFKGPAHGIGEHKLVRYLPIMFLVFGIASGTYFIYKNPVQFTTFFKKYVNRTEASVNDSVDKVKSLVLGSTGIPQKSAPPPLTMRDIPHARLMIHSFPAGAEISVDSRTINGTTPEEVELPLNQKVTITIRREGYIPYTKDYIGTSSEVEELQATLQKAIVGYVSIDVKPFTADIYINGQKLTEKPPIERYAIPAGKPVKIKAVNPYTNSSDQQTVTVKQDTVTQVNLFLRRSN